MVRGLSLLAGITPPQGQAAAQIDRWLRRRFVQWVYENMNMNLAPSFGVDGTICDLIQDAIDPERFELDPVHGPDTTVPQSPNEFIAQMIQRPGTFIGDEALSLFNYFISDVYGVGIQVLTPASTDGLLVQSQEPLAGHQEIIRLLYVSTNDPFEPDSHAGHYTYFETMDFTGPPVPVPAVGRAPPPSVAVAAPSRPSVEVAAPRTPSVSGPAAPAVRAPASSSSVAVAAHTPHSATASQDPPSSSVDPPSSSVAGARKPSAPTNNKRRRNDQSDFRSSATTATASSATASAASASKKKKKRNVEEIFTPEESAMLLEQAQRMKDSRGGTMPKGGWDAIAELFPGKKKSQCKDHFKVHEKDEKGRWVRKKQKRVYCKVENCPRQRTIGGLCHSHAKQQAEAGNKRILKRIARKTEASKRYYRRRYQNDLAYRLKETLRRRTQTALVRAANGSDTSASAVCVTLLGCSLLQLVDIIQRLFTRGMSWDNQGTGTGRWQ